MEAERNDSWACVLACALRYLGRRPHSRRSTARRRPQLNLDRDIATFYASGIEEGRLNRGGSASLEHVRTLELLTRYLPVPPARILDVGGGPGVYAEILARDGYDVHLVDPVPLHCELAQARARTMRDQTFHVTRGDARALPADDEGYDAVLMLGPLYHLTERRDRILALEEARRAVRQAGVVIVVAISRFFSLLLGLVRGLLADPSFRAIVEQDLATGQHRNPDPLAHPEWFTTAFFHHPEELRAEIASARLELRALTSVEGVGWLLEDRWDEPQMKQAILDVARALDGESSFVAARDMIAVAAKEGVQ